MVLAGSLRPGTKIIYNDEPYVVIDVTFVKPGKGGAFARTKAKNLLTSLVREVTFRNEEKLEQPDLEYKTAQYLYKSDNKYYFMDQESFEEIFINEDLAEDVKFYFVEQESYTLLFWAEKLISVSPPIHMNLKVVETVPGVKGDTAQGGATKPATLSTGLVVNVPLFVDVNDFIKIDTRTGEYIERIKK
jgi:elongation factor P